MVREFVLLSVMALYFYFVCLRLLLAEIYSLLKSTHNTHVICRWVLPVGSLFLLDTWEFGTKVCNGFVLLFCLFEAAPC